MRLFTVANSQPVLGETVYSYSVNGADEETVTTFGRAYTKHNSTEEYISSTDSVKTKNSLSWNGWEVLNTESESDFFGRTTGKHYTVNLGEDDHPNFGTEYTYADTETTATNKISRVKNTLNGAVKSDYGYTYDNRGNILTVSKSGVLFQQYVYDEASQVKAEYNYAEHTAMTYVYDANGNIVSKTPYTNVTSSDLSTATQGTAIVYGYGDGNWSDKLTSYDGQTISYDASGNPTSYRGETVTWNGRLMTSFTKDDRRYEYSYNSDGMRTVKRVYEGDGLVYTFTYIWDGDVLLAGRMERPGDNESITIRYLYDDSGELYGMDYNGNGYFAFIKNLQGDIVSIVPLDSESNVEVNMEYDAWGKPIIKQASSAAEGLLMAMLMAVTNVGYRGYFYDFETELYYLRSRYYDPETGRFINADDTDYLGYDKTSISLNLFSYCCNCPINKKDINGKWNNSGHDELSEINIHFGWEFIKNVKKYNKICDSKFPSNPIRAPFHSIEYYQLSESVSTLVDLAIKIRKNKTNKKYVFKYSEVFSRDGFTYRGKNEKNYNDKLLKYMNSVSKGEQVAMLTGFCLHMIQDFYAHRVFAKVNVKGINGWQTTAKLDELLNKKMNTKRYSIEDNKKVLPNRFRNAKKSSLELVNYIKDNKPLNCIGLYSQIFNEYQHKYVYYDKRVKKTIWFTSYRQVLLFS